MARCISAFSSDCRQRLLSCSRNANSMSETKAHSRLAAIWPECRLRAEHGLHRLICGCPLSPFGTPSSDSLLTAPFRTFQMNQMHDLACFSAGLDPTL